jgi:RimJ/RimL family protein N-acetyltransferase
MQSAPPRAQIPKLDELPLVIDAQRITLRPIVEADADELHPYASDPEVA